MKKTYAIIGILTLTAFLCVKVALNANRVHRVRAWLGLDAPISSGDVTK